MSTVKANTIEPASGGTVTITGAALTTPALGTPASGTLTNCTGFPVANLSGTTMPSAVVNSSLNAITPSGGALTITGTQTVSGNVGVGAAPNNWGSYSAVDIAGNGAIAASSSGLTSTQIVNGAYYNGTNWIYKYTGVGAARYELSDSSGGVHRWFSAPSGTAGGVISFTKFSEYDSAGHLLPGADNTYNHGSGSYAIKQIYTNNSVIVTSDGRLKTARSYTAKERAVARRCRDLGVAYQWNDAIAQKGADRARIHFGTTVQSVIAAFEAEGLDPFRYGVVCYDEWEAELIEHPAIEARSAVPAVPEVWEEVEVDITIRVNGDDRPAKRAVLQLVQPAVPAQPAVQAREAYTETVREAGNRYSLRLDQLAFFIATAGA